MWWNEPRGDRNQLEYCQAGLPCRWWRDEQRLEPGLPHTQWVGNSTRWWRNQMRAKVKYTVENTFLYMVFPGVKCPVPGNVPKGRVTPSLNEYFYRDHIYVRCDQGYKLMMVSYILSVSTVSVCFVIFTWYPYSLLSGGSGDWEFLYYVPKQWTMAPPSARMPQYVQLWAKTIQWL